MSTVNVPVLKRKRAIPQKDLHKSDPVGLVYTDAVIRGMPMVLPLSVSHNYTLYINILSENQTN